MGAAETCDNVNMEVSVQHMAAAREHIVILKNWLDRVDEELAKHHNEGVFPIRWCNTMMEYAVRIHCEVSIANGAILAGLYPKKEGERAE